MQISNEQIKEIKGALLIKMCITGIPVSNELITLFDITKNEITECNEIYSDYIQCRYSPNPHKMFSKG